MDWLTAHWEDIVIIAMAVHTIASIIVRLTPTPKDDAVLGKVVKLLSTISLNKGKVTKP